MKFVDFEGSISSEVLLHLSTVEQLDKPMEGKESIVTLQHGRVFVFTPTQENNYCVRYYPSQKIASTLGRFHNGVCQSEDEVMKIITNLKEAEIGRMGYPAEGILQSAHTGSLGGKMGAYGSRTGSWRHLRRDLYPDGERGCRRVLHADRGRASVP